MRLGCLFYAKINSGTFIKIFGFIEWNVYKIEIFVIWISKRIGFLLFIDYISYATTENIMLNEKNK